MMETTESILTRAIDLYKPVRILLMVSGGYDSITNAHICAAHLSRWHIPFEVYHGDTTIGIPETQEYVKMICELYGWKLNIRRSSNDEDWYDNIVARFGFPGKTRTAHRWMHRKLKERAIRCFVTYECKSSPLARENVLLLTGIRQDESAIRMGYSEVMTKDNNRCWVSPIFYMTEHECRQYRQLYNIPQNPVRETLCISGECLCGAWAGKEELIEIKHAYPHVYERIMKLKEIAAANGFPWGWGQGPNEWKKEQAAKKQMSFNFMCVGCERKQQEVA